MAYEGIPPLVASVTKAVVKMADGLTEQEKRDLRFVFDVYDPKQTGLISADDVVRAMIALAFSQSRDVIEVWPIP